MAAKKTWVPAGKRLHATAANHARTGPVWHARGGWKDRGGSSDVSIRERRHD
jgi:hypothetical protein